MPQAFRWRFHIWLYELPPMRKRISRILQAKVYVFSIKCVTPIDKPNLCGYNIPAVCTAGISGGVGHGTNGNPAEAPRGREKRISGKRLQGRISKPNRRRVRLHEGCLLRLLDVYKRQRRYGDMQAFVQKLRVMGYGRVELIDTTVGSFMTPKEAKRLMLRGSTLLVGRK